MQSGQPIWSAMVLQCSPEVRGTRLLLLHSRILRLSLVIIAESPKNNIDPPCIASSFTSHYFNHVYILIPASSEQEFTFAGMNDVEDQMQEIRDASYSVFDPEDLPSPNYFFPDLDLCCAINNRLPRPRHLAQHCDPLSSSSSRYPS